ncbi:hypothetical protein ATCVCanal1_460L [Acanthocystis turfacea Chlorella virus Canal-1]|nr:hypothetical protein ATCVCanal1_460L [Acanthocystis turfacea Chlorella virus Canal-1]
MKKEHTANLWIYNQSVRSAQKTMVPMELSAQELMSITDLPCLYCGEEPLNFKVSSVDRLVPEKGFVRKNVVPACDKCVRAKGSADASSFILRCLHISHVNDGPGAKTDKWNSVKFKPYEVYKAENLHKNFKLTEDEYYTLRNGNCSYCCRQTTDSHMNGIDRVNNNVGYIRSNCVTSCHDCNLMKLVSKKEEFLVHMKKIAQHVLTRSV